MPPKKKRAPQSQALHTVRQIALLAQESSATGDFPDLNNSLTHLVLRTIARGSDHLVMEALNRLIAKGDQAAAEHLSYLAETLVTIMPVAPDISDPPLFANISVFLIPLIILGPEATTVPRVLSTPDLAAIVHTFRHFGFDNPVNAVEIQPGLYSLDDLPLTWSERYQWLKRLATLTTPSPLPVPSAAPDPPSYFGVQLDDSPPGEIVITPPIVHLRFVIGYFLAREGDPDASRDPMAIAMGLNDTARNRAADAKWRDAMRAVFSDMWPEWGTLAYSLASWMEAWSNGVDLWNDTMISLAILFYTESFDRKPNEMTAEITWDDEAVQWRIALHTEAVYGLTWGWLMDEPPAHALETLIASLQHQGIQEITKPA